MNRIKEVLEQKGIKQTWLTEKLGKSYNMVNAYAQNRQQPRLEIFMKIAEILDIDVKDLIISKKINTKENWKLAKEIVPGNLGSSIGKSLYEREASMNNFEEQFFEVGQPLNAIIYDNKSPLIESSSIDNMASTILYSSDASTQQATIINGKEVVTAGKHFNNESISNKFYKTIRKLDNR